MKQFIQIIALSLLVTCFNEAKAQSKNDFGLGDYQGVITVNSVVLAEEDQHLHAVIEIWVSGRSVQNYVAMHLTPKLYAEENYRLLPDIMIQGGNKTKTYNRWQRTMSKRDRAGYRAPDVFLKITPQTDTLLVYDVRIPYELWMDDAVLAINQEIIDYRDQRSLIVFALGGKVTLATKEPYQVQPRVSFTMPQPEQKSRKQQGQAFLDFQAGRSEIVPSYRRNPEELAKIRQAFNDIVTNPDVNVNGLFIEGYASPEGKYATNERLSMERSNALRDYIIKNFNLPISYNQIRTASVAEDWEGLRKDIEASDRTRKGQIMTIIDNTPDPDLREVKLRQLPGVWAVLMKDFFPQLRRVEYQIDFTVKDYSIEEAKTIIGKNDILLSQQELYKTAMNYGETSPEFEKIMLEVIPRQYADNTTATINAAAVMIRRGETATAKRYLEKFGDNPAAWNNLGVIYIQEGDLDRAEELLRKAAGQGVAEAEHNLREVDKKRADNAKMERYKL